MATLIIFILTCMVFGKLAWWAVRATWSVAKVLVTFVFFPLIILGLILWGLAYLAVPILLIVGVVAFASRAER